jgi:biopolymer transport protein ExbB
MASISEALVATAVGLMVAIPALIATNFMSRKIKTLMAQGETTVRIVMSSFFAPNEK